MRNHTLSLLRWSPVMIEGSGELHFAIPGDVLRKRILKLAAHTPPLDARLGLQNEDVEAHLLHPMVDSGVAPIDG